MRSNGKRGRMFLASLAVVSLVAATCSDDPEEVGDADGDGLECTWTIATMGAFTGDFSALGLPISEGVEYAVDRANQEGGLGCDLVLAREDSQGDPDQAAALAQEMVGDRSLVFCACPYFSAETLVAGPVFSDAGVAISGIATADSIDESGLTTWFRAVVPDEILAEVAGTYLKEGLRASRVVTIHDDQIYSKGQAEGVAKALGNAAAGTFVIDRETDDYSAVVDEVKATNPDAIFYGGYTPQAGFLAKQLRDAGVTALFMSDYGAKDPTFGVTAGRAASGALVSCPCADPNKLDLASGFVNGMRGAHGRGSPGPLAAEMYDVTNLAIEALRRYEGDPKDIQAVRAHVVEAFQTADEYEGIAKSYSWSDTGEFEGGPEDVWIYEWSDSRANFVSLGPVSDLI